MTSISELSTHQKRKEARKTQHALYKEMCKEPAQKPVNRKKANPKKGTPDTRRPRPPVKQRAIYRPVRHMSKPQRAMMKQLKESFIEQQRNLQTLKQLQNKLEMTQKEFLVHCEKKLTEDEFKFVLELMDPPEYVERYGQEDIGEE